jgi:hypothetical protein
MMMAMQEPYIITIEEQSKKFFVLLLDLTVTVSLKKTVKWCSSNLLNITRKYGFIPNPDGGFYDIGFGHLLGPY